MLLTKLDMAAAPAARRQRAALLAAAAALLLTGCSVTAHRTARTGRTIDFAGPVSLDVETRNGAVSIRTDPAVDRVEVEAYLRGSASSDAEAEARVATMDVSLRLEPGGILAVRPVVPGSWRSNESVSFDIVVPALAMAEIETSNGRVTLAGATRASRIDTGNGSVVATNCHGGLDVDTSNASVTVTESSGDLRVSTSNGSVKVVGHDGAVDLGSSNGRITVSLAPGCSSPFKLDTSNGSIDVDLGTDWSGSIDASTSNGRVTLRRGEDSERRGHSAMIDLGGGGERSTASSSNGSIEVRVRQLAQ